MIDLKLVEHRYSSIQASSIVRQDITRSTAILSSSLASG
jgi:hypothetical protein